MSNEGKLVKIHYTGTLEDGTKFDSSYDKGEPIEFVCMDRTLLPRVEMTVKDMVVGETRNIRVPAINAYGEYHEQLVQYMPISTIPNGENLPVGQLINLQDNKGENHLVHVLAINDGIVTLDHNHPLAGKDLFFEITLLEVNDMQADA